MGLLRKHIRDDAGKRVPVYRTGLWPGPLAHEVALTDDQWAEIFEVRHRLKWKRRRTYKAAAKRPSFGAVLVIVAILAGFGLFAGGTGLLPAPVVAKGLVGASVFAGVLFLFVFGLPRLVQHQLPNDLFPHITRRALLRVRRCPSCGFELDGRPICPECGATWKRGA